MIFFSPSILAADFGQLGEQIRQTERAGAQFLHIDVMDGLFVPSISMGMPVIKSLRKETRQLFDVHLMIREPIRYIEEFAKSGADYITFHLESCQDAQAVIDQIHACGKKAGLAINPGTEVTAVVPYLESIDMLLVMSVEPGFGGQAYLPQSTQRLRQASALIKERGLSTLLQVDGGVDKNTVDLVLQGGANMIVAGSSVYRGDPCENTRWFMEHFAAWEEKNGEK